VAVDAEGDDIDHGLHGRKENKVEVFFRHECKGSSLYKVMY
jgi:hypothetical protein